MKVVSKRLQRVTQWMSCVTATAGSARSSSQVEAQRLLDLAEDVQVPRGEVDRRARCPRAGPATSRSGTGRAAAAPGRSPASITFCSALDRKRGIVPRLETVTTETKAATRGIAARPRSFVRVKGPDAASYLQRMVSNDVLALDVGEVCEALLLTPKARVIAPARRRAARRGRLPAAHRAGARRDRPRAPAANTLRGQVRDRGGGAPVVSSSSAGDAGGHARRADARLRRRGVELRRTRPASRPRPRTSSSALRIAAGTPRCGREIDDASCRPRQGSTSARSPSRRGATRARSRSRGCATAATPTAACACSSSTAASRRRTTRSCPRRQGRRPRDERRAGRGRVAPRLRPRRGAARRDAPRARRRGDALHLPSPRP